MGGVRHATSGHPYESIRFHGRESPAEPPVSRGDEGGVWRTGSRGRLAPRVACPHRAVSRLRKRFRAGLLAAGTSASPPAGGGVVHAYTVGEVRQTQNTPPGQKYLSGKTHLRSIELKLHPASWTVPVFS